MKHEIEIEGLPEGWRAVAYRRPVFGEYYFYNDDIQQGRTGSGQFLIVEKIKPRRIVIEETGEDNIRYTSGHYANQCISRGVYVADQPKIWREVKEGE